MGCVYINYIAHHIPICHLKEYHIFLRGSLLLLVLLNVFPDHWQWERDLQFLYSDKPHQHILVADWVPLIDLISGTNVIDVIDEATQPELQLTQTAKAFISTYDIHRSGTKVSNQYLTGVDLRAFVIWNDQALKMSSSYINVICMCNIQLFINPVRWE